MNKNLCKIICVVIALNTVLMFSACSSENVSASTAVTVGNANVGADIYTYFLDETLRGENAALPEKEAFAAVRERAAYYVKINTEFKKRNLSLSSSAKAELASDVNSLWNIYGTYYKKLGITKETLTKIKESEAYEQAVINSIYGEKGEKAISEDAKKEYFKENFVFFKAINAYISSMSDEEVAAIKTKFEEMKDSIGEENTIDAVNLAYVEANGGAAESEMPKLYVTKTSDVYPEKFFSDLSGMENSAVAVLSYTEYIFLVQKIDGSDSYSDYSDTVLKTMVADEFKTYMETTYKDTQISSDESVEKDCYSVIGKSR